MLEDIHATPEDRRSTLVIVNAGVAAFGVFTLLDGIVAGGTATAVLGAALGLSGLGALQWARRTGRKEELPAS